MQHLSTATTKLGFPIETISMQQNSCEICRNKNIDLKKGKEIHYCLSVRFQFNFSTSLVCPNDEKQSATQQKSEQEMLQFVIRFTCVLFTVGRDKEQISSISLPFGLFAKQNFKCHLIPVHNIHVTERSRSWSGDVKLR